MQIIEIASVAGLTLLGVYLFSRFRRGWNPSPQQQEKDEEAGDGDPQEKPAPADAVTVRSGRSLVRVRSVDRGLDVEISEVPEGDMEMTRTESVIADDTVMDGVSLDDLAAVLSGTAPAHLVSDLRARLHDRGYALEAQAADIAVYGPEKPGVGECLTARVPKNAPQQSADSLPDCFRPL